MELPVNALPVTQTLRRHLRGKVDWQIVIVEDNRCYCVCMVVKRERV
jgi:hypothetical protein